MFLVLAMVAYVRCQYDMALGIRDWSNMDSLLADPQLTVSLFGVFGEHCQKDYLINSKTLY